MFYEKLFAYVQKQLEILINHTLFILILNNMYLFHKNFSLKKRRKNVDSGKIMHILSLYCDERRDIR